MRFTTAVYLALFWILVCEIYYCGKFGTFLDLSMWELLLRYIWHFFGPLYVKFTTAVNLALFWTLVCEVYYCGKFGTFLDPSIYVVMLYEIVEGGWIHPIWEVVSSLRSSTTIIFEFWHFSSIFVQLKVICLVTQFESKFQVFKKSPKIDYFWHF